MAKHEGLSCNNWALMTKIQMNNQLVNNKIKLADHVLFLAANIQNLCLISTGSTPRIGARKRHISLPQRK